MEAGEDDHGQVALQFSDEEGDGEEAAGPEGSNGVNVEVPPNLPPPPPPLGPKGKKSVTFESPPPLDKVDDSRRASVTSQQSPKRPPPPPPGMADEARDTAPQLPWGGNPGEDRGQARRRLISFECQESIAPPPKPAPKKKTLKVPTARQAQRSVMLAALQPHVRGRGSMPLPVNPSLATPPPPPPPMPMPAVTAATATSSSSVATSSSIAPKPRQGKLFDEDLPADTPPNPEPPPSNPLAIPARTSPVPSPKAVKAADRPPRPVAERVVEDEFERQYTVPQVVLFAVAAAPTTALTLVVLGAVQPLPELRPWAWVGGVRVELEDGETPPGTPPGEEEDPFEEAGSEALEAVLQKEASIRTTFTVTSHAVGEGERKEEGELVEEGGVEDDDDETLPAEERLQRALAREKRLLVALERTSTFSRGASTRSLGAEEGGADIGSNATAETEESRNQGETARQAPLLERERRRSEFSTGPALSTGRPTQSQFGVGRSGSLTPSSKSSTLNASGRSFKVSSEPGMCIVVPVDAEGQINIDGQGGITGQYEEIFLPLKTQEGDYLLAKPPPGTLTPQDLLLLQLEEYSSARNTCLVVGLLGFIFLYCCHYRSLPQRAGAQKGTAVHLFFLGLAAFALMIVLFVRGDPHNYSFGALGAFLVSFALAIPLFQRGRIKKRRFQGKGAEMAEVNRSTRKIARREQRAYRKKRVRESMV
eukprot:Sspe_Gene.91214::Locus_62686_Transcript_2_10_Confidence_0.143_Length_2346::g.91214::m.91214